MNAWLFSFFRFISFYKSCYKQNTLCRASNPSQLKTAEGATMPEHLRKREQYQLKITMNKPIAPNIIESIFPS